METKRVVKSQSESDEFLIVNPPYTVYGTPHIVTSQSIIMKVGGLKKMIEELNDDDSFRIEWFANKQTEYSFLKAKTISTF